MKNSSPVAAVCLLLAAVTLSTRLSAQTTTAPTSTDPATADSGLAEVLVTANKRGEQSLLDTPMAIQAIGAEQLKSEGIKEFGDYARMPDSELGDSYFAVGNSGQVI